MSAHFVNYRSTGPQYQPVPQVQPTKHKILKSHLKIVSRSNDKSMTEKVQSKDYSSISKTVNLSSIKNLQGTVRKGLKLEVDNRLNKVYSHIVKYRSISLRPTVNQSNNHIAKLQKSQQQGFDEFTTIKQQTAPTLSSQLPYQLLRAYVQSIYEDYQIKDPLEECGKEFQINLNPPTNPQFDKKNPSYKKTQRMTVLSTPQKNYFHSSIVSQQKDKLSTKKKILQLKRHFINQLSMTEQTTQKKQPSSKLIVTKKINMQTDFKNHVTFTLQNKGKGQIHQNQITDYNSNHKLAQTKLTTVSNNNNLRSYQSVNLRSSEYQNPTFTNSRVQQYTLQGQTRFNPEQKKISQTFRYCFVCEQPVLQTNIKIHEKQCTGLKELLNDQNLNKQKLMFLIQNKIHKVQKQLEFSFHQIQSQNLNQQFAEINNYTKQWISKFQQKEDLYSSEAKINSLIENTNVLKTMELINKLKWFVHLKKNFLKIITK